MAHRTLDAAMIDTIIASAPERARRVDWAGVMENAADFAARLESPSKPDAVAATGFRFGGKTDVAKSGWQVAV
jgi:dienelactone hydrolase